MLDFPKPDIEQYLRSYTITHFAVSKDERLLVFSTNLNGAFNLWAMDLPNQSPYLLTFNNQNSASVKIDPEIRFLITEFDHDGDENYQIYALAPSGGEPLPLLTGEKQLKFYSVQLSKDGRRLYYMTSKDNPQFLDTRVVDLKTKEDRLLIKGEEGSTFLNAVSPNEKNLVYLKQFANTYILGYVQSDDRTVCLTPNPSIVHTVTETQFIDDHHLLFVTNYQEEFAYLASFDLEKDVFEPVLKLDHEDIMGLEWHEASRTAYLTTEKGVQDRLYAFSLDNGTLTQIDAPLDTIHQLAVADSGNLYLLGRSATESFNLYKRSTNDEWQSLTNNRVPGIAKEDLVEPEVVTFPSYDGLNIEALWFQAKPDVANGYTVFWPHGGPQAAERKSFRGAFQFLLGRGYNIFAPNFRGSTGYGASFTKMIEGDWGEGPRLDCVKGIEWLFENGLCDRDRLFLFGGSYGGYMTLLLAGRHAEYFRACVDIFGPSNLFTFIESVPDHWKPIMERWVGDPVKDKERLEKDSPITYLDGMTKPMLVIQGANDPRVVKAESDQIVAKLRERGAEVEYLVFDDEGHGFSKKANEIKAYRAVLDFFEKHRE